MSTANDQSRDALQEIETILTYITTIVLVLGVSLMNDSEGPIDVSQSVINGGFLVLGYAFSIHLLLTTAKRRGWL